MGRFDQGEEQSKSIFIIFHVMDTAGALTKNSDAREKRTAGRSWRPICYCESRAAVENTEPERVLMSDEEIK